MRCRHLFAAGALALLTLAVWTASAAAAPPSDELLPASTKGYLSIPDAPSAHAKWEETRVGRLLDDPIMKPFAEDIQRQLDEKGFLMDRLGLTWDEVHDLMQGEFCLAYVHLPEQNPSAVLLVDILGMQEEAKGVLEKAARNLVAQGYRSGTYQRNGIDLVVLDPPKVNRTDDYRTRTVHFIKDDLLCATESWETALEILQRLQGERKDSLKDVPGYQAAMQRCDEDAGGVEPDVRWYVDPFGFIDARRMEDPRLKPEGRRDVFEILKNEGFTAIQCVAGTVQLNVEKYDILHRTVVYAPPPYTKAMRAFQSTERGQLLVPAWAPADLATLASIHIDALGVFDHIGSLYNAWYDAPGFWEDTLDSLENDKYGPQINVREALVAHLKNRAFQLTAYRRPITPDSRRTITAFEAADTDAVAKAVDAILDGDPAVRKKKVDRYTIYEVFEEEAPADEGLTLESDAEPPLAIICMAHGYVFCASHLDFLQEVLKKAYAAEALVASGAHRRVETEMKKLAPADLSIRTFSQIDLEWESAYELFRTGKLDQAESTIGVLLRQIRFEGPEDLPEKYRFDGSKLPEFDKVRHHFGPAGLFGTHQPYGWFLKGFILAEEQ